MMLWRFDWVVRPPDVFVATPTSLDLVASYARLSPQDDGSLVAVGRRGEPALDVTPAFTTAALALAHAPNVSFLTPVGTPARVASVVLSVRWRSRALGVR